MRCPKVAGGKTAATPRLRGGEAGGTENMMVGWNHQLNGPEFGHTPRYSEGLGSWACCTPWGYGLATEQQLLLGHGNVNTEGTEDLVEPPPAHLRVRPVHGRNGFHRKYSWPAVKKLDQRVRALTCPQSHSPDGGDICLK